MFTIIINDQFFIPSRWRNGSFHRCNIEHTSKLQTLLLSLIHVEPIYLVFFILQIFLRCFDQYQNISRKFAILTPIIWDMFWPFWLALWSTRVFRYVIVNCRRFLPTWSSGIVTQLRNFRNHPRTDQSQMDVSPHVLLMLAAVWVNSWKKVNASVFHVEDERLYKLNSEREWYNIDNENTLIIRNE